MIGFALFAFLEEFKKMDEEMCFTTSSKHIKNVPRNLRGHYTYVLCDEFDSGLPTFNEFEQKVFYTGKGSNDRCFDHLRNAKDIDINEAFSDDRMSENGKLIKMNWINGKGVHVFRGFECSTREEALNREAAVIECIGISKLTNKNKGTFSGGIKNWSHIKISNFGMFILYVIYMGNIYSNMVPVKYDDIRNK